MPISPDALLGALVTIGLAFLLAMWKLATMLAEVRSQVRHNGGDTLKDKAADAARDSAIARREAEQAREQAATAAAALLEFRKHQADDTAATRHQIGQVQHDVTNVRAAQELLLEQQLTTDQRVTDHRDRNAAQVRALQEAVEQLGRQTTARDEALQAALQESLDVAIAVEDAREDS